MHLRYLAWELPSQSIYVTTRTKLSSGISTWECTAGRLNCNQISTCSNRSRCPSRNQSLLPQACLGCDKWLSMLSLLQHKKKDHCEHRWWTETSQIVTNACLRNAYSPKSHTHTQNKCEKLTELRIFVQTDFWTQEAACMAFHKKWPMWHSQSESAHLASCWTDPMHLFPAFPSCWNLKRTAIIYLWHASEETLPNPLTDRFVPFYLTVASNS